jgi:hypothetical protein
MRRSFTIAAIAAALVIVGSASAQSTSGSTNGFSIGAQVTGAGLNFSNASQKVDFGGGWGVQAGYGFGEMFSLIANYDHNALGGQEGGGTFDLGQWDALARFNFMAGSPIRPYLEAGATGRAAKTPNFQGTGGAYTFSGISPTAGLGAQLFVSRQVSVNAGLDWTFGNFSTVHNEGNAVSGFNQLDATGTRVRVGATLYPFGH